MNFNDFHLLFITLLYHTEITFSIQFDMLVLYFVGGNDLGLWMVCLITFYIYLNIRIVK